MLVKAINSTFVEGTYREANEEFDYAGGPNDNLKPLTGRWPTKGVQPGQATAVANEVGLLETIQPKD